ncbi:cytochrome P450/NAD(P)H-flavin reductase/ferredoxin [Sphingomonas sp. BE270]|jgi:benzoate/toluate 1,2-dioxygenase reductase subunit|uniref:benzoate 1,2-dioxygenase electron transfer component BenC n=1 Tax=Sphingomonas sp. BE270 TaxID=2817726 RepID=UPI00285F62E6|nr:benzoate 1,2-dioxygenase electron transfer component BenC [Sphingomonas sp. BE270]MDR7260061.1 cytochrome P450/NAD(P)H-flavin reductase/ferredoxin [Sphingomonas sp. BE270]
MAYQISLRFEDGVTQFIECNDGERVTDAALRAKISIPLDCRDGVCGTCKATCESGDYEMGDYVEDALSPEEVKARKVLTCQMSPLSDCVIQLTTTSDLSSVSAGSHSGRITACRELSPSTFCLTLALEDRAALGFLPGQYVNIQVPGTGQTRSYSFSSGPAQEEVSFLIKNVPQGAMSTYLRDAAEGDTLHFRGPLGSFYLRPMERRALFLAGGTGLAPFLSMLGKIVDDGGSGHPIHLIYGVNNDEDLVAVDRLEAYAQSLPSFTYSCTVANEESTYPQKGYVTHHITPDQLNGGDADVYLCGPPPMVDAVRAFLSSEGLNPRNFYYEKFAGTGLVVQTGEEHIAPIDVDEAFDLRMALELGAAQLTIGRLSSEQLIAFRALAEATAPFVSSNRFADLPRYAEANHAFHMFLIEASGNAQLIALYKQLAVQDQIARALRPDTEIVGDIVEQHRAIVTAFEHGDINAVRDLIAQHSLHSKATMSRAVGKLVSTDAAARPTPALPSPQHDPVPLIRKAAPLPAYSHELEWPAELEPFKVVDDGSQGDPYEHYRWMREHAPVLRCQSTTSDVWFLSRYDDVYQAIRTPKLFSSEVVSPPPLTFLTLFDPPNHTRLRKVLQPSFMPLALDPFVDHIMRRASDLMDALIMNGGGDVVDDFAIPLSISTISSMLEVPAEDEEKMKFWSDETFSYFGRLARNAPGTGTDEQSAMDFFAYLKDALERLSRTDSPSIGGHIARMWKDGHLSEKEAKELCAFVFIAGHDTTTILIANAFRIFTEQPHLIRRIRETPDDADSFVEEVARYRGTVQRVSRITTEATEVAGVELPKGAIVRLLPSAANRDSRKYVDGDTFNIDRDSSGHLGFGNGMHKCLGAPLAKLETMIATKLFAERVGEISFNPNRPIEYVRGNNLTNSGPAHLHVQMSGFRA